MGSATSRRRWAIRGGLAGAAAMAAVAGVTLAITPAQAADVNPFSPAAGHPYRHGAVPTIETAQKMAGYRASHPRAATPNPANLVYGGAVDGIGVTTGKPRVYIVFWGKQWGSPTTDANGDTALSGDGAGVAPRVQELMKGIGAGGELWSGVTTQYCEGIAKGLDTCPASASHVGYPTGGALAGVWADVAANAPASATEQQIGDEAVAAAHHFGNTNTTLNRNAQYVIVSPHGTTPDGFNTPGGGFCAWHDFSGDPTLTPKPPVSDVGDIAFTNLPYVTDAGGSCGQNFVNAGTRGTLDGVTIVEGHEYAETITDQNPPGGWVDGSGEENGDKCAWISTGDQARSQNVTFQTGQFAMQSTWSNDSASCQITHPIVGGTTGGTDFALSVSPLSTAVTSGTSHTVTVTVQTTVIAGSPGTVSLSVSGLPAGTTGTLSPTTVPAGGTSTLTLTTTTGTPRGSFLVSVAGTAGGVIRQAPFDLAVYAPTGSVSNGSFEHGLTSWTTSGSVTTVTDPVHSGLLSARIGLDSVPRSTPAVTSTLRQTFTVRSGHKHLTLSYRVMCIDDQVSLDWFTATLKDNTSGKTSTLLGHTCERDDGIWKTLTASVTAGHSYTLTLTDHDDGNAGDPTFTYIDDVKTTSA